MSTDKGTVLSLFDVQGKLLYQQTITETPQTAININLKQGIYIIKFLGKRNFSGKIVK